MVARIRGKGHHIFQQWDEGSSKTIVEVRGVSLFFSCKRQCKTSYFMFSLRWEHLMNIIMEILFSFNLVINVNSSEAKFTNYETAFSNYPTFNKVIQMNH